MKRLAAILALALVPALAAAAEKPEWAFPVTDKEQPPPRYAPDRVRTVGNVSVTRAGADDFYNIPNWRPDMYPPMPKIVQFGNKDTQVRACGSCHLPTGTGHDESAYMVGLTARYFIRPDDRLEERQPEVRRHHGRDGQGHHRRRDQGGRRLLRRRSSRGRGSGWSRPTPCRSPSSAPATSGWCIPPAAPSRSATASSRCRRTRRRWSIAIRSPASSPMCRRAASPRARRW